MLSGFLIYVHDFLECLNTKEQNLCYLCSLHANNQKAEVKWGHIKWQMLLLSCDGILFFRNQNTFIYLLYISTWMPCQGPYQLHVYNWTNYLPLQVDAYLSVSFISTKSTNTLLSYRLEIEESFSLLSSFLPESINCFSYQSCLCRISPSHSLLFFSTSNLVIHVTVTALLDYRNNLTDWPPPAY